jgi:hypothetical protein
MDALLATGTQADAADWLGITEGEFAGMRARLNRLGKCLDSNQEVNRSSNSCNVLSTCDRIRLVGRSNDFSIPSPRQSQRDRVPVR